MWTRLFIVILAAFIFIFPAAESLPAEKAGFQFSQDTRLQQIKPKKPVKIKLKRTARNEYHWELTGDDPDEIIKTDRKLRKMLNEE